MIDEKDFKNWLRNKRQLKEESIKKYTSSLLQISSFLVDEKLIQSSIYEVDDVGFLKRLRDTYFRNQENREKNKRGNRRGVYRYCPRYRKIVGRIFCKRICRWGTYQSRNQYIIKAAGTFEDS